MKCCASWPGKAVQVAETPLTGEAEYWRSATQWVECQDILDALLQPVLDRLLAEAALSPGQRVLDIGCGTGASTMAAARQVGADGHVTGADISDIMLDLARERTTRAAVSNVTYVEADAQTFAFEAGAYDIAISRFGVMFFGDPPAAFRNIARAVADGGEVIFLCWSRLAGNPWFAVPRAAAIEVLGAPDPADPRAPGPMAFADQSYVRDILTAAGWQDISISEINLTLTPKGSVRDVAAFATQLGPASRIIKDLGGSAAQADQIEDLVAAQMAAFDTPEGVRVPATLNLVRARAGSAGFDP